MSLSYSGLVNHGKITLPSVGGWGTNMNIIKDPPKALVSRRRDKVGDTNDITKMIDDSNRSTDAILRFARGVNPSVSVSYTNNGGSLQNYGNQQAFLPYTINKDGDFRVPVPAPHDLLSLSRLPRESVKVFTNPHVVDFSKELPNSRNQTTTSNVKSDIISSSVRPTKTYIIQKPAKETFDIKYNIQDTTPVSCQSNMTTNDRTTQNVIVPTNSINDDVLYAFAQSNMNDTNRVVNDMNYLDSGRFIQDTNAHQVYSNLGSNEHGFNITDISDLSNVNNLTKDTHIIDYGTTQTSYTKENYIHDDLEFDKNLPNYSTFSNRNGGNKTDYIHSDIYLQKTLPEYQSHSNKRGAQQHVTFIHDDVELSRNLPEYNTFSNHRGNTTKNVVLRNDIELTRNLPEYESKSNRRGNASIKYIHGDIELDRAIPIHQSSTNYKEIGQKNVQHDYIKEYERKAILSNPSTNINGSGENNVSSRNYFLEEKIQGGEYNIPAQIPTTQRLHEINQDYETDKSKMSKLVMEQFQFRYNK